MEILIKQSLPTLLSGLKVTLEIAVVALIIATVIGLFIGLMNISHNKILKIIAAIYIDIIRGTPLIVQAFFIYFALPGALNFKIDPLTAGIVAISLNAGAYIAEIFRGGIMSIDKGQTEAARSLGLSYAQTMRKVILPQAIRRMIPALINQFIISLKDTSILSVIGLQELTQSGEIIIASTYRAFAIWTMVGLMYFIIITIISNLSRKLERRLKVC
ncbi:amino acid ABC transporter permease [Clostridium pasteurianum]|uniref:Amine acid ABC transporter, permease protein, 3-TM region, His/Glu/Gln/Arg/opine family n=1 Tax=Clostridium pasteurianum BC1 TaxID=86416 RepID=R4K8Z4_CLOPA|nr:amino acid ABC transporter permease [Clostridium pasteurianum]AGK98998.1 amine acid ABC transporter, permease protein, 3-TM region, His/Glu/Gln/Arg/opine family [Clostridium pasteurianum BC1]